MASSYAELRPRLSTGDVVLFSGDGFVSRLIRWGTRSRWSHVGLVVTVPEIEAVMLWESTTLSKQKDLLAGVARSGVQLVWLSERVRTYGGDVAVRQLTTAHQISAADFGAIRRDLHGRPYEESECELLAAAYDGPFGANDPDLSSIFCSELVAETYKRLGVMQDVEASNEYTPDDFAGEPAGLLGRLGEIMEITA